MGPLLIAPVPTARPMMTFQNKKGMNILVRFM